MLVSAMVLFLAPLLFIAGTSLGRAFGRSQAFEEATALLRFDAARAAARGQRGDALLLRLEANRLRSATDGGPSVDELEPAAERLLVPQPVGDAGRSASF
jgi:hypothetical protein